MSVVRTREKEFLKRKKCENQTFESEACMMYLKMFVRLTNRKTKTSTGNILRAQRQASESKSCSSRKLLESQTEDPLQCFDRKYETKGSYIHLSVHLPKNVCLPYLLIHFLFFFSNSLWTMRQGRPTHSKWKHPMHT